MKKGDVVMHILTGERVLIIDNVGDNYLIRINNYAEIVVKSFELEPLTDDEE